MRRFLRHKATIASVCVTQVALAVMVSRWLLIRYSAGMVLWPSLVVMTISSLITAVLAVRFFDPHCAGCRCEKKLDAPKPMAIPLGRNVARRLAERGGAR